MYEIEWVENKSAKLLYDKQTNETSILSYIVHGENLLESSAITKEEK